MMKRIQQLEEREKLLRAVLTADNPAMEEDIASSGLVLLLRAVIMKLGSVISPQQLHIKFGKQKTDKS
jgi:hypothetical protein